MVQSAPDTVTLDEDSSDVVSWTFAVDGTGIDWTGWTASLQVRDRKSRDGTLLGEMSTDDLISMDDAGVISLDFTEAFVAALGVGTWYGDLRIVSPSGRPDYALNLTIVVPSTTTAP